MLTGAGRGITLFFSTSMVSAFRMSYLVQKGCISDFPTCLSLIIEHLRIFVIVSTVILKNGPVDSVAKLVVEVDGDLVAHPEKLYQSKIWE